MWSWKKWKSKGNGQNSNTQVVGGGERNTQTKGASENTMHRKVQDKRSPGYNSRLLNSRQESIWVNKRNLWARYKGPLCNADPDNMTNRRPGTDWEQNSLRYFCMAEGGCHIAGGGGKGGWAARRGCLVGELLATKCPSYNAAPLVYISWSFGGAFVQI